MDVMGYIGAQSMRMVVMEIFLVFYSPFRKKKRITWICGDIYMQCMQVVIHATTKNQ